MTTVDARLVSIAREIADARSPEDIQQRSFGSAVLAATYRGLCKACMLKSRKSGLVGCPLLLQLWSYERFPIGRPYVYVEKPFDLEDIAWTYVRTIGDLPTMGSVWTRREVFSYLITIRITSVYFLPFNSITNANLLSCTETVSS